MKPARRCTLALLHLSALLATLFSIVDAAPATTWHTNGPLNFTASSGTFRLTDSSTGRRLVCSGPNGSRGFLSATRSGNGLQLFTITPTASGCTVAGITWADVCDPGFFNGVSWVPNGGTSPNWYGSVTTGSLTGIVCNLDLPGCPTRLTGSAGNVTFTNATMVDDAKLTMPAAGQSLTIANAGGVACRAYGLNNGDRFAADDGAGGPVIWYFTSPARPSQPEVWV